ncbi:MAG: sigma-54 dependent transcriptional regulator [Desulfosarcinaceae bacterium]|jgi:DNA-binding NtrC family response regulator
MSKSPVRLAIVEDEEISGLRLQEHLADAGYPVDLFLEGDAFLKAFTASPHDLVITDLKMPCISGMEILKRIKARHRDTEVVVITGYASVDSAIEAVREGAFHYLTKPIRLAEFDNLVARVVEKIRISNEASSLRALMTHSAGKAGIIGTSPEMERVYRMIEKIAPLDCPVIIQGESGTGKELVARAIHFLSHRHEAPIISFNCGGFSPELIANELFGHEKGAFTGAYTTREGLLQSADGGTVLLDEIADMPAEMQVKLLRVLQEGQIYRLGSSRPIHLDIRILAASNRDLKAQVEKGAFREDLFFRLNVMTIFLPRLVDRTGDLWLLADHFLHLFNEAYDKDVRGFSTQAREALARYDFPGNVRELENVVARAVALAEGKVIQVDDLPEPLVAQPQATANALQSLEEMERAHIAKVLRQVDGHRDKAAAILGITRSTLWRKINKYNLSEQDS